MNMSRGTLLVAAVLLAAPAADRVEAGVVCGWYFPPPGEGLEQQQQRAPREVGLRDELIAALQGKASRWALWRHGYLVHVEGDWNKTQDVASLRKTWHAMTVGAAIQQGRIPTYCQPVRQWVDNPGGARVTWWHLITQTSALDYPHADYPDVGDPAPGEVWTYSDKNPRLLCNALARVYGKTDFHEDYADVQRPGRLIRDLDPFGHPLSGHDRTGPEPYRDSAWTAYGTLLGPKTTDRKKLSRGLLESHHAAKPLLAQETLWSGNKHHPDYPDDDLRKNAYVIVMSGATLVFGDMAGDSSSGFSGTLDLQDRRQPRHDIVRRVWDLFDSATIPLGRLRPRQDLVDAGYRLAEPGKTYLVYLENGGDVNVDVAPGSYQVTWIRVQERASVAVGLSKVFTGDSNSRWYGTRAV